MSSFFNPFKDYNKYAKDVVGGDIVACEAVILACKRYISWFERDDIYFDEETVDKYIRFVSKMKHTTGIFANKSFNLLPWQAFAFANIYGWKWKSNGFRVTKKVFMFMSRKNAKTSTAAALALIGALIDNEPNAEVACVANNSKQAAICFEQIKNYAESIDPKSRIFKKFRHNITVPMTKSHIDVYSSDSMGLDGYNVSLGIVDELHSQKDWGLYNVLVSSQAMRTQPLMCVLTTAGFLIGETYPCYSMYITCKQILKGIKEDDTQFALIYELDEGDDWLDEKNWIKCSPSLGTTVRYEYMREQVNDAINNTSLEVGVKTKNFNMWCQSSNIWLTHDMIQSCMQPVNIDDYYQELTYGGTDLSSVGDLTAVGICIPPNPDRQINPDKFIFKAWIYIPEEAISTSPNKEYYKEWIRRGWATKTAGNVVDYDYILKEQIDINKKLYVAEIGYDSWNSTQYVINAEQAGLPMAAYSQTLGSFNKPTKFFEMLVRSGRCIIDANPALDWMFANVELKEDMYENCKPVKANAEKNNKIDGVIAVLEALGCYLNSNNFSPEAWVM